MVAAINSTVVAYLPKQGGTHSFSLYRRSKDISTPEFWYNFLSETCSMSKWVMFHGFNIFRRMPFPVRMFKWTHNENFINQCFSKSLFVGIVLIQIFLRRVWIISWSLTFLPFQTKKLGQQIVWIFFLRDCSVTNTCFFPLFFFLQSYSKFKWMFEILFVLIRLCNLITTFSGLCKAFSTSSKRRSILSLQVQVRSFVRSLSARLITVRNSRRKGGTPKGAIKRITGSVRQFTSAVYDSKLSISFS